MLDELVILVRGRDGLVLASLTLRVESSRDLICRPTARERAFEFVRVSAAGYCSLGAGGSRWIHAGSGVVVPFEVVLHLLLVLRGC